MIDRNRFNGWLGVEVAGREWAARIGCPWTGRMVVAAVVDSAGDSARPGNNFRIIPNEFRHSIGPD